MLDSLCGCPCEACSIVVAGEARPDAAAASAVPPDAPVTCGGCEVSLKKVHLSLVHRHEPLHTAGHEGKEDKGRGRRDSFGRGDAVGPGIGHPVFDVCLEDLFFTLSACPSDVVGKAGIHVSSHYHNSKLGSWEPFLVSPLRLCTRSERDVTHQSRPYLSAL